MGMFTGIGDFFRGAFGEDDEEKRRRKQREAQEAAARQQRPTQQRPTQPRPQQPDVLNQALNTQKPNVQPNKPRLFQAEDPKQPPKQAPRPTPLPDQQFKGLKLEGEDKKTIFGREMPALFPKGSETVKRYSSNDVATTNKDKYVASFDKLSSDKKKILVNQLMEQANVSNDQAAINSLKALDETNRLKGNGWDFVEGNADKLAGIPRGILRGADFVLPGKNTFGLERFADVSDQSKMGKGQYSTPGKVGEKVGSIEKGIIDAYTLLKGTGLAEKGATATGYTKALEPLLKSNSRFARFFGRALKEVPGSATGTAISSLQTAGKGDEQNLAKDAAIGLGADIVLPYASPVLRRLFGKGGDFVDDAVKDINVEKYGDDIEKGIAERARRLDDLSKEDVAVDGVPPKTEREQQLDNIIKDENEPAYIRKQARQELEDIASKTPSTAPLDRPAFQHREDLQNAVNKVQNEFNDYINKNPDLSMQQIEEARQQAEARAIKLTDELKANRYGTEQVVANQADEVAKTLEDQGKVVDAAKAEAAAKTAPPPGEVVQDAPVAGSPELRANDATRQSTDEIVNAGKPTFDERGRLSRPQLLSPDRVIRENITRPLEAKINEGIYALQTSDNRAARGLGRFFNGFSREAGITPELQTARMQLRGGVEGGKVTRDSIANLSEGFDDKQLGDIWATIDEDFAARAGMKVSIEDLSPEQLALRQKLVDIRDNTTVENMRRNLITKEQAANGEYITRDYSVLYDKEGEVGQFEQGFRQELLGQYRGRKVVSDEMVEAAIKDPTYLVAKKQAQSEAAWAMQDYGNFLVKNNNVSDVPKPGFTQLPDIPLFGDAAGKFIPKNLAEDFTGFQYDMAITSAFNDLVTAYDRIGLRQAKKALLTVFNPAVRLGNQVTNRGIFSQLAGINPAQFNIAMEAAKNEIKSGGQLYREAVQQGLTGVDITHAEFFAQRVAKSADGDKNIARKALDHLSKSYSEADDQARIAAYMVKRQQGYDPVEAARQVQRGFQDYKSVGFFYDLAAKTPIIGNAFVRFAADSARIAKNAAIDHPLRAMGTVAAWSAFVNGMSVISGESELQGDNPASKAFNLVTGKSKSDAQRDRENRFGSPKLPFSDISTAVQTPFGEINVARFMPWYQLNDIPGANPIQRVLPFSASPVNIKDGKIELNPQGMNDPLLGQLVQLGIDKDFRGKSIRDPLNTDDKFRRDPLSTEEQLKNVGRFLFNNNAPVGREIDQTASAIMGVPDMYGKERSVPQAIARDFGLKIEQQGDEQAKDRAGMQAWQEENAQIEKELEGMSPDAQQAWRRLTGIDKMREQVPNEFAPGEMRYLKAEVYGFSEDKYKDFSTHPELYDLMVEKKQREFAKDGKPIPPEFDSRLSESFRKQLIQNKTAAPGDDAELDQRMYSSAEWDYYSDLKDKYKQAASKYYPKSDKEDFDDETVKHNDGKFPDKPPLLKQYSAAYKLYSDGKAEKPEWNDTLTAAKEAYNKETLNWTNQARKARGLPAITWDVWNNPTFGFDETPSGFGFGFGKGGGGGGGGGARDINTLTALTNFSSSVNRYKPIEAQAPPNIVQLFQKLMAGKGGGRVKPKLGASSSGRG